ncbi:hypothetical protein [Burkholderia ambifaria]|uniref:hypothetical protein n=1 Tax=Burkholderia ambifaria TaxID=152480 RepID=UPI003D15F546
MTTDNTRAAIRVCAISDVQCSRDCGTDACKREREARYTVEQHEAAPADMKAALQWTAGTLQEIVSGRWKGAKENDKVSIGSVTKTISQVLDMADAALPDVIYEAALAAAPPPPAPASAADEDAFVVKRLSEALADVYTTLIGDDKVDADETLNAIQRVEKAAQVLRLEVELYRAQASAPVGLTDALRRAREELSNVEWENDPPARITDLFSTIDALLEGAKQ